VFKTIAETLAEKDHNVWVITNKIKNESYQEADNLRIITVKPELEYSGGLPPSFTDNIRYVLNAFHKGRTIVKRESMDLIHSNNFSPALAGSLISYFTGVRHITTIHDIFSSYDKDFWKRWANQSGTSYTNARLGPFFEKLMMNFRFDCIHTVSNASKNDIKAMGTKKPIYVIPNCLQEDRTLSEDVKRDQFVYLGRLVFYKNLEVVLRAFAIVSKQFPKSKLVIAGNGPHKESLQDLVKRLGVDDNVSFEGYVTTQQKTKLLAESNALLFPSKIEGFGLVILEAFEQKRPVLVSNIPPMSDIIQDGSTGFVIDANDEKNWAYAIISLIKNLQKSDQMGKNGNNELKTKYNQELFFAKLIKMYNDVLAK